MAILTDTFKRLENNLWSIKISQNNPFINSDANKLDEIRIIPPSSLKAPIAYKIAKIAASAILEAGVKSAADLKNLSLAVEKNGNDLNGRWEIKLSTDNGSWFSRMKDKIPFFHQVKSQNKVTVKVVKLTDDKVKQVWNRFSKTQNEVAVKETVTLPSLSRPYNPLASTLDRIKTLPFSDPFTSLAAATLQTIESPFVYGPEVKGSLRIVLSDESKLEIQEVPKETLLQGENSNTVEAYHKFIKEEYGDLFIATAEHALNISFSTMIEKDLPLYPDIIFKMNILANDIRLEHLEDLALKLKNLNTSLSDDSVSTKYRYYLNIRELRALFEAVKPGFKDSSPPSDLEIHDYLLQFEFINKETELNALSPSNVNKLVKMLMVPDELRDLIYTGRKITHLAICGYPTMGDADKWDPSRDLHELLQIFPDLKKQNDWNNYYELLAHVVTKKNLFRQCPSLEKPDADEWKVGLLIPAPLDINGHEQWYVVQSVIDDGDGNFSYVLEPLCDRYKKQNGQRLPLIKLYRSTASNENAVNSEDSVRADANPIASPGPLDPKAVYKYENPAFNLRTIPVWVGYLINAKKFEQETPVNISALSECILKAIDSLNIKKEGAFKKVHEWRNLLNQIDKQNNVGTWINVLNEMYKTAGELNELPENKIAQDVVFVGHSLGGALAQQAMHLQSAERRRIPCPGCNFICYAGDPPAIDSDDDQAFMAFGRLHKELILSEGQKWQIIFQMEYGDIVPESGQYHLGTSGYDKKTDAEWIDISINVFKPLPTATAIEITTMRTHGRRIGLATLGTDYNLTPLTPNKLHDYHSWFLSRDLRQIYGYSVLVSPKTTELARRILGALSFTYMRIENVIKDRYIKPPKGKRDQDGKWFLQLTPKKIGV